MELHGALMLADRDELIARMHSAGFQLDDLASDPPNESEQPVVLFSRA